MTTELVLDYTLSTDDVDASARLTAQGLLSLLQRMATAHGRELAVDFETMREKSNVYWVVTKVRGVFESAAGWNVPLKVETWPLPSGRITCERDMTVKTASGETVARVTSEWCLLDWDTHRIRKVESTCFPSGEGMRTDRAGAGEFLRANRKTDEMELVYDHLVRYTDMDLNRHTNNVVYAKLAMDTKPFAFWEENPPRWFEIHFLRESHEGDVISLYQQSTEDGLRIVGVKQDGEAVFVFYVGL
ncbi:MAG: hypothetical protein IJF42_08120 [Clostridia bacterium]|nr:hypothetical protein [Clostridia bacterium]